MTLELHHGFDCHARLSRDFPLQKGAFLPAFLEGLANAPDGSRSAR
jgi:hypothetical protein